MIPIELGFYLGSQKKTKVHNVYMWLLVHALSSTTGKLMLAFSIFDVYDPFDTSHCLKSLSTRGPGRSDTCYLTDFSQTFTDD